MCSIKDVDEFNSSNCSKIFVTMVVATSEPRSEARLQRLELNVHVQDLYDPYPCFTWLVYFLAVLGVPPTFLNGCDCDMVEKLSRMLCDSILQRREAQIDYVCIFVMVLDGRCCYNMMNMMCFFHSEFVPSSEFVQRMASEGGNYSLPAGETTLERFTVQDEQEDSCVICLEEFNSNDDAARLPCSHVCHYDCILKWFVESGTCPMCRFQCSLPFYHQL